MSNVGPRSNTALLDEPKTRIAVATAVAFGLWCAALVLVGELLVTPEVTAPPPPNLDAQLVEIEPPPAPRASTPARPRRHTRRRRRTLCTQHRRRCIAQL